MAAISCFPDGIDWGASTVTDSEELLRREIAEELSWGTLQVLSGGQIGMCPVKVRPTDFGEAHASLFAGAVHSASLSLLKSGEFWCPRRTRTELLLPGPVGRVDEVRIDGAVVTDYQRYGDLLVRESGWPRSNRLGLPDTEEGTWSITYVRGVLPDRLLENAATVLAKEYVKALTGDGKCRLPKKVQAVSRNGVQYEVDANLFEDGRTRIDEVDLVVRRLNPHKLKARPVIASIDGPRFR
jgi:hypothetical protein